MCQHNAIRWLIADTTPCFLDLQVLWKLEVLFNFCELLAQLSILAPVRQE